MKNICAVFYGSDSSTDKNYFKLGPIEPSLCLPLIQQEDSALSEIGVFYVQIKDHGRTDMKVEIVF